MSNKCYVVYKCFGHTKDVIDLAQNLGKVDKSGLLIEDAVQHLANTKNVKFESSYLVGRIKEVELNLAERYVTIVMVTKWCEETDFRYFLQSIYKNMKVYYLEEDFSEDLYYTNDLFFHYFPERYALLFSSGINMGLYYYKNLQELINGIEKLTGITYKKSINIDDVNKFIEEYNNDNEVNSDQYSGLELHELTYSGEI